MQLPPNIVSFLSNLTTNATANTSTITNLIGGPGAGTRLRLWRMECVNVQNAAAQVTRFYAREIGTGTYRGFGTMIVGYKGQIDWSGFGGIALPANVGIAVETFNTLTNQLLACFLYYTVEAA